jgi:hypothetical protein
MRFGWGTVFQRSVLQRRIRRARRAVCLALGTVLLAACSGSGAGRAPTIMPTRTLIPPTATPTPPPADFTPTPTDLPSPATLAAATAEAASPSPVEVMIEATTRDLVASGVAPADIRLLSVDGFAWQDATWGCAAREGAADGSSGGSTAGYRIAYSAGSRVYVYHTDLEGAFFLCDDPDWLARNGTPILVDPIASATVALCRADAARRLGIAPDTLQLTSLVTVTWPDDSVGCPQPGIAYSQQETPGYRIVLRAGGETLVYHTSAHHMVLCAPDKAILPGPIRQALATPVPRESE